MTGEKSYLEDIKSYSNNYVTFNEGANGKTVGKVKVDYLGVPCLNGVLLVDGLTTHLISISKICDQDLYVKYNRVECIATDKNHA